MTRPVLDLPHALDRETNTLRAVIETPAGLTAKLTLQPESGLFELGKLLPVGLAMPVDFGFVPSTRGGDGDALDVMVLNEAQLPAGCLVTVRLLGAIEVRQGDKNEGEPSERNDRIVARLCESRMWSQVERIDQLGDRFIGELNRFFGTYKDIRGQRHEVVAVSGPDRAADLVEEASEAFASQGAA